MQELTERDILALFLAREILPLVARQENIKIVEREEEELPPAWRKLESDFNKTMKKLKKQGRYFHEGGGSVFTDYKNLRDSVVSRGGMEEIAKEFSSRMSKEELLEKAREVVEEWQQSSGQERKG